ncbi:MAG: polysaccharide pyruvyl transferase family protein [Hyphomonadaceae bacterium]|nr:polysaccharide pyruvyl transferase family protein [Hyphomonadaceae bacterium]GIK47589.1 MAG: hypothetical protein BroJett013_02860 [Alphaproteobacteria bacterium]
MSKSDKVKPPHIAIYGMFGVGNTGNDATLEVTLAELRRRLPDVRVTIITTNPELVEAAVGLPAVAIRPRASAALPGPFGKLQREWGRWRAEQALLREVDCLLIPGTGILDDFGAGVMEHPYPLWRWCTAARQAGAQVKFVSVGAGPVKNAWSRRFFRWAAGGAGHRSYRDASSRAFVRDELKLDVSNDVVTPDIVLALDVAPAQPPQSPPRVIGVGVMDYHSWTGARGGADAYEPYIAKMAAFADGLLRQGCAIRILTGDTGDAPAVADFHARLARDAPEFAQAIEIPAIATLRDLCAEVAKTDAVVATRYHTIIAALISGRPAVSIGYSVKNQAVMGEFGLGAFCQDIGDFDVETLRRHFEAVTRDSAYRARLRDLAAQKKAALSAHFDMVATEIAAAVS